MLPTNFGSFEKANSEEKMF